ncbi:Exopolyphosphatase [hydrothermal vent metagenome]|uniref:Exopolyphosphatase n=1 Tax=hydrothermal vent metagenome TaxID=652676 RepID=A0A3B0T2F1_9ZZZZ
MTTGIDNANAEVGRQNKRPRRRGRRRRRTGDGANGGQAPVYGALDLGTNNCRLLLARPQGDGFRVVDAFSRIIRLGEGVSLTGRLSEAAIARAVEALKVCTEKMIRRNVVSARLIATEACRVADNADEFIFRVRQDTGLNLEIISSETEAHLAVAGCSMLLDREADAALVFDIGGGSSELVWVEIEPARQNSGARIALPGTGSGPDHAILGWLSLPVGVVNIAERFGGIEVDAKIFESMVGDIAVRLEEFENTHKIADAIASRRVHLLGTSGTVTTVAGIHLGLPRYDRRHVDGCWLDSQDALVVSRRLLAMNYDERVRSPCVGHERADLVLAGCAILEAIMRRWPCDRLRVADRGLREGILSELMAADGYLRAVASGAKA